MKITYESTEDVLCVRFSDAPVAKDVSYDGNVSVGYDADGQLADMTILDFSSVLPRNTEKDETTLVLTERESRRLLELMESPPPRTERFLAAIARHSESLRNNEPSVGVDTCAWMAHQAYLFTNRRGTRMKVLIHDGHGIWLAHRRLNQGRFHWRIGMGSMRRLPEIE